MAKLCRLIFSSTRLVSIVKAMPMVPRYSDFVSRVDNIVEPVAEFVCIIALWIALVRALFSDGRRTDGLWYVEKTDLIVFEEARFLIRMHARVDFRLLYKTKSTLVYG